MKERLKFMNQYEVLYAVKDDNKENMLFAAVGEAPHPWRGWSLESTKVMAVNYRAVEDMFYANAHKRDDGREYVFIRAQLIKKLQWIHRVVVAVKVNPNPTGWRIKTISVKTNSETSDLIEIWDLVLKELQKKYPDAIPDNYVFLDRGKPEVFLNNEN